MESSGFSGMVLQMTCSVVPKDTEVLLVLCRLFAYVIITCLFDIFHDVSTDLAVSFLQLCLDQLSLQHGLLYNL